MISDDELERLANDLAQLSDVVGVTLGGSRARGTHTPESDADLGIYYREKLDTDAVAAIVHRYSPNAHVTALGGWGPYVNGGSWMTLSGAPVDLLYRDLDRVEDSWASAASGFVDYSTQLGHPLGTASYGYAAELALSRILADDDGELALLRLTMTDMPLPLRRELIRRADDALFLVAIARKAVYREDSTYIAGCLFEAMQRLSIALCAVHGEWVINEKGAVALAGRTQAAPPYFAERAGLILGGIGFEADELQDSLDSAEALVQNTLDVLARHRGPRDDGGVL